MRSRKGVTPAIATVLLISIVVSSTGAALAFIMTSQGELTEDLESDLTNTELRENTRFNIESIQKNPNDFEATVRNTGSVEIDLGEENLEVFVDNKRLSDEEVIAENNDGGEDENILNPNEKGTATVDESIDENTRIRFIGPYGSSDTFVYTGE